ncbi:MAG TPA: phosphatidylserine decarboxylase, partial [Candidatus Binatus sp.]|nr:phosphatidylserine decarboxylase [Candidatus Binatus sp.]
MKIAREGYPLILTAGALAILALALGWAFIGAVLVCLTLGVAGFFRDPVRIVPSGDNLIVAPADGKVVSIGPAPEVDLFQGTKTRISIFLSPLDVHINRIPVAGKISEVR